MSARIGAKGPIPFEVRKEMIRTLFGRQDVLILGCIAHVTCMFVAWGATTDPTYLLWAPLFTLVTITRLAHIRKFDRALPAMKSMTDLDPWDWSYTLVGSGTSLLVGLVAAYSGFADPHSIAPAIGQGLVGGTMITIVGRNFGSLRNVIVMILTCCAPMIVSFAWSGWIRADVYIALSAFPIGIVILVSTGTATNLHGLLLSALRLGRQSEIASQKFEAAIGSMPNGLIVVDGDQKMMVINLVANETLSGVLKQGDDLFEALRASLMDADHLIETLRGAPSNATLDDVTYETTDGRWLRFRVSAMEASTHAYLDDEWGGRQEGAFILTILDVTKKVEADRRLEHLARYDGLTGLANRHWWETRGVETVKALPAGSLVGLAVLDADRFKNINDTLGHHIGDKVIQGIADRIRALDDPRAFSARLGGDEFVVLLLGPTDEADARDFFDRLFESICDTYPIQGHNVEVRCSGGVIIRSSEEFQLHTDLSRADMALYKVKRTARPWMLFDSALEEEYQSSIRIKHDLKRAIENEALELVYQPIYEATGERIVSAEALCRWEHAEAGAIPPSQFIAMAEEIGVIGQLTEYVLRRACRECMTWESDVSVAVNLSALDLARDGIVEMIAAALEEASMPADRLCIEVTESVFVKDFDKTAATLSRLRDMGIKTSLDDFGTGYSSLSYMNNLPLNRVKIDKSFVTRIVADTKAENLFKAIVGLAKSLEYEVVVEGVEERGQLEKVLNVPGVDLIQGHIFSKGLSNSDMAVMGSVRRPAFDEGKVIRLVKDVAAV
jgi:diguanylate cyclase (GGDEF)-like protein